MSRGLIMGLWGVQKLSFNDFFPDRDRIYQVRVNFLFNGEIRSDKMTPAPLAVTLKSEIPEVEFAVKYADWGHRLLIVQKLL